MGTMRVAANNTCARIVGCTGCSRRNVATLKSKKSRSLQPTTSARVCAVSSARLGSVVKPWSPGSKKDEQNPELSETLLPAEPEDVLEADEMWSFVFERWNKRWLWTVICRRTRQIVAYVLGDRSEKACQELWDRIPQDYKGCRSYSDFWEAYQLVFPPETHECVGKGSGQTNHMERWYNKLRQSNARFVRKTLSFSKSDAMHELITRLFIIRHNLSLIT